MTYVIADIHGCYNEYKELLLKIKFCDDDELFVLGDAMDRGPEPIKVIEDLMNKDNVTYIMGNHDYMMLCSLKNLAVEITEETLNHLTKEVMLNYYNWVQDGGEITAKQFVSLSKEKQIDILDYLESSLPYELIECNGVLYILVHAGIRDFDKKKELDEYDLYDFLWERADYSRKYFSSKKIKLVTGHTPTPLIRDDSLPKVFQENGHIALDCGCVFGGTLAVYCIENGEITYVSARKKVVD